MRRIRIVASAVVDVNVKGGPEQRRQVGERIAADPELTALTRIIMMGPETAPAEAFTAGVIGRLLGRDSSVASLGGAQMSRQASSIEDAGTAAGWAP